MHFGAEGDATLTRPICDVDFGYGLTAMKKGIQLTTGIEIADRDALPMSRQFEATEAYRARHLWRRSCEARNFATFELLPPRAKMQSPPTSEIGTA